MARRSGGPGEGRLHTIPSLHAVAVSDGSRAHRQWDESATKQCCSGRPNPRGFRSPRANPPSCPHGHSALSLASCRHVGSVAPIVLEELSDVRNRPMIVSVATTARPQQRYDHRLRSLVQRTGDATVATDLGVPRSTARGWLSAAPTVVVGLDVCGPHGAGAPTGGPEAAAARPRAHGASSRLPCYEPLGLAS